MGTIADKLQYLKETKNLIKQAIIEQGVEVAESDTFRSYAQKVKSIGGGSSTPYQKPSDWLTIPTMDGTKDEIYILNGAIKNGLNMIFIGLKGTGTIDWGDGTTESFNVSSETDYSHNFNYDDLTESSWTNHNRSKQALIHIYGDRGAITVVNFAENYSYTNADGRNVAYNKSSSSDIYEINADVERCNYTFSDYNSPIKHSNIEIFDWKGKQNRTSMDYMFTSCFSLQSIPQLDTSNVTYMGNMFSYCYSLLNIQVYNAGASTKTFITLSDLSAAGFMTKQALVDLFNSVAPNNVEGHTRTLQLGTTLQGYLADCYVKDSGIADTCILPTSDTEIQSGKTYYIYNEITNTYSEATPDFTTNTFYYELVTASWNKYIICDSTDENAMLALDYARNIKGWTIS